MKSWTSDETKKCWICGKPGAEYSYVEYNPLLLFEAKSENIKLREELKQDRDDMQQRMFCKECFERRNAELSEKREQYARLKKQLMLERAVRMLEKQALDIYQYRDIIEDFEQYVTENPEKFDSAHEMIASMMLVDNGIKAKIQYKIDRYRVDFYIPDMKIVLEIDGELHAHNLYRDNERDIKVREVLGHDWETVRIGTKYLEQNAPAMVDAMIAIKNEKIKLRSKHHGYLPEWYSTRNKAQRTRSIRTGDDHLFDL